MLLNIPLAGSLELPEGGNTWGRDTPGLRKFRVITCSLFLLVCLVGLGLVPLTLFVNYLVLFPFWLFLFNLFSDVFLPPFHFFFLFRSLFLWYEFSGGDEVIDEGNLFVVFSSFHLLPFYFFLMSLFHTSFLYLIPFLSYFRLG